MPLQTMEGLRHVQKSGMKLPMQPKRQRDDFNCASLDKQHIYTRPA